MIPYIVDKEFNDKYQCLQVEAADVLANLPPRKKDTHKGDYGKVLLMAGSEGMCGAAVLAGRAALRSGCGLLTIASVAENRNIIQISVPEALFCANWDLNWKNVGTYTAVGIGCGWGKSPQSIHLLTNVLRFVKVPLVIDADGLNLLADNSEMLAFLPKNTILTPHPKEFERLAGQSQDRAEQIARQQDFSNYYGVVVVLKGHNTSITFPATEEATPPILFNPTGNPGMATGGSGDVLTGMVVSLLAQGLSPQKAAYTAVYLHGLAGDLAAGKLGETSLIAGDIVEYLPMAIQSVQLH